VPNLLMRLFVEDLTGYEPAGVIHDFEYHDQRSKDAPRPAIDLYVAIRPTRGSG
jgi:predicted transcriptional regulator YdeE